MPKKTLLVVLSGIGDGLIEGRETSLQRAAKSTLDLIAKNGYSGLVENSLSNPSTELSLFSLLGYSSGYPGDGLIEALSTHPNLIEGDVLLRANFCTVREQIGEVAQGEFEPRLVVEEPWAGREKEGLIELSKSIESMLIDGVKVEFHKTLGYRGFVLIRNADIKPNVTDTYSESVGSPVNMVKPTAQDSGSVRTAATLNKWLLEVWKILNSHPGNRNRRYPANFVLLRGASTPIPFPPFYQKTGLKGHVVAGLPSARGLGKFLGMNVTEVHGANASTDTNLRDKTLAALDGLRLHNFSVLHISGFDRCSHERNANLKRAFIEKVDNEVFRRIMEYINLKTTNLVVVSDHCTPVQTGQHEAGKFPFAIAGAGIKPNSVSKFTEEECKTGPLVSIENFMEEMLKFAA